ncbi:GNAT family N-acetyltransferase [Sedimentibacter sp.]|uniref:GNAT family N-acetyltransferase n=1 Tax=Sedimentibacter sp. TaxID=1960295 RepID=UPI002896A5EF|nr:GNAT family N-acetyltransferase [Sedimentibacter sp.]
MNHIIETKRLIIREFDEDDIMSLYRIESNRKLLEFIPWYKLSTLSECRRQLSKIIDSYGRSKLNNWAVALKDTGEIIGITQLTYSSKIKAVEIGTKILPEYWSKGYASELTEAVIEYGLYKLNIGEIIAVTDINNTGAIKSLEKSGMKFKKYGYYNGSESVFYAADRE